MMSLPLPNCEEEATFLDMSRTIGKLAASTFLKIHSVMTQVLYLFTILIHFLNSKAFFIFGCG